jgi:hypothetical protein
MSLLPVFILLRDTDGYPRGIVEGTRDPATDEVRHEGHVIEADPDDVYRTRNGAFLALDEAKGAWATEAACRLERALERASARQHAALGPVVLA